MKRGMGSGRDSEGKPSGTDTKVSDDQKDKSSGNTEILPDMSPKGYSPWGVEDQLLTVKEVAAQLKVTHRTVLSWIRSGYLPAIRMGRTIRVSQSELTAFLDQHEIIGPT